MNAEQAAGEHLRVDGREVELHHTAKVFWPRLGLTKGDLVDYYRRVAPHLLPHLKGRPITMRPFPNGVGGRSYYRWEIPDYAPSWVHRWPYRARTEERVIDMVVVEGLAELIWVVDLACIEMHPWLSRVDDPEHPDRVVFDLDPGPGAGFPACLRVADQLRAALAERGTRCYAKTSGGKGVHVVLPVARRYTYPQVRAWVKGMARWLAERYPGEVTDDKALAKRRGKVLVDYSQNALGKSIASAYSVRANPAATVSTPLTWDEVAEGSVRPEDFTLLTVPPRLEKLGDLFAPLAKAQDLPPLEG